MSTNAPAIPLFGDAYMADTTHLTLEEHGAYLKLMMVAWRIDGCCLPDDDARLARILGITAGKWAKIKLAVMAFWSIENGVWIQARLSKERAFVEKKRQKNSDISSEAWAKRKAQDVENKQPDECERIDERNAPPPPPPKSKKEDDANASSKKARVRGERLSHDWQPTLPLPETVADLVAQWPPDRLDREIDGFRDYWTARTRDAAKLDWNKTWHNRIRDQHDRILREGNYRDRASNRPIIAESTSPSLAFIRHAEAEAEREGEGFDRPPWPEMRAIGSI
jgi:uncharacterized protein YdaU (DUF1376 family)